MHESFKMVSNYRMAFQMHPAYLIPIVTAFLVQILQLPENNICGNQNQRVCVSIT
jgi:hypothetical protein